MRLPGWRRSPQPIDLPTPSPGPSSTRGPADEPSGQSDLDAAGSVGTAAAPGKGVVVRGRGPVCGRPAAGPLVGVDAFVVPAGVVDETLQVLQQAGRSGSEAFVVWGGVVEGGTVRFTSCITPVQQPAATTRGLLVSVAGKALFEINQTLYRRGELLAGQVHSHPTDAFHSDTDDHFPLATTLGALSVVIPDFARHGIGSLSRWAFYRLAGTGLWNPLNKDETVELLP